MPWGPKSAGSNSVSEGVFRFKQFAVVQRRSAMKVGTDGVLLGAWTPLRGSERRILDIGTGTGLVALMLAQRTPADTRIEAIEIDPFSAAEAAENFARSPWSGRLQAHPAALQQFHSDQPYDLIVANPPFFVAESHKGGKAAIADPARLAARQAGASLPFPDLIAGAVRLLGPDGRLAVILPPVEAAFLLELAASEGLTAERTLDIYPVEGKPLRRRCLLLARSAVKAAPRSETLILGSLQQGYTQAYRALTEPFLLWEDRTP